MQDYINDVSDDIFAECYFRLKREEIPKELLKNIPKCLRKEGCFCNLDGLIKKKKGSDDLAE